MTRSEGRVLTFELLYSLEIQKIQENELEEQLLYFTENNEITDNKTKQYIESVIKGVRENEKEISELISKNLTKKWEISRISKVDLALLKLGIYEIIYSKLPFKVVINEVIEIAKKYGDDTSSSFINGVLANVIKQENIE